jgi:hypothetical protein
MLDPNAPLHDWASAVRELWNNPELYSKLSVAAEAYSHRSDLNYSVLLNRMEEVFMRLGRQSSPNASSRQL